MNMSICIGIRLHNHHHHHSTVRIQYDNTIYQIYFLPTAKVSLSFTLSNTITLCWCLKEWDNLTIWFPIPNSRMCLCLWLSVYLSVYFYWFLPECSFVCLFACLFVCLMCCNNGYHLHASSYPYVTVLCSSCQINTTAKNQQHQNKRHCTVRLEVQS